MFERHTLVWNQEGLSQDGSFQQYFGAAAEWLLDTIYSV